MVRSSILLMVFYSLPILIMMIPIQNCYQWPSSIVSTTSPGVKYEQGTISNTFLILNIICSFAGYTSATIYGVKVGSVSNSTYLMYGLLINQY